MDKNSTISQHLSGLEWWCEEKALTWIAFIPNSTLQGRTKCLQDGNDSNFKATQVWNKTLKLFER